MMNRKELNEVGRDIIRYGQILERTDMELRAGVLTARVVRYLGATSLVVMFNGEVIAVESIPQMEDNSDE